MKAAYSTFIAAFHAGTCNASIYDLGIDSVRTARRLIGRRKTGRRDMMGDRLLRALASALAKGNGKVKVRYWRRGGGRWW